MLGGDRGTYVIPLLIRKIFERAYANRSGPLRGRRGCGREGVRPYGGTVEPGPRHIPDSRRAGRDTPLLYEVRASRSEGGT